MPISVRAIIAKLRDLKLSWISAEEDARLFVRSHSETQKRRPRPGTQIWRDFVLSSGSSVSAYLINHYCTPPHTHAYPPINRVADRSMNYGIVPHLKKKTYSILNWYATHFVSYFCKTITGKLQISPLMKGNTEGEAECSQRTGESTEESGYRNYTCRLYAHLSARKISQCLR